MKAFILFVAICQVALGLPQVPIPGPPSNAGTVVSFNHSKLVPFPAANPIVRELDHTDNHNRSRRRASHDDDDKPITPLIGAHEATTQKTESDKPAVSEKIDDDSDKHDRRRRTSDDDVPIKSLVGAHETTTQKTESKTPVVIKKKDDDSDKHDRRRRTSDDDVPIKPLVGAHEATTQKTESKTPVVIEKKDDDSDEHDRRRRASDDDVPIRPVVETAATSGIRATADKASETGTKPIIPSTPANKTSSD